jgi:predicted Zn-dependent protease
LKQAIINGYNDASRLFMENKLDTALAVCLSLLKQVPGNSVVLNLAGSALYRKKMLPEAESLLLTANEITPERGNHLESRPGPSQKEIDPAND